MDGEFWQWVAMSAIGVLCAVLSLFVGTLMTRVRDIEQKANDALPRREFTEHAVRVDEKLDAIQDRLLGEFRALNQRIDGVMSRPTREPAG